MARLKYMGTSDIRRILKGDTFGGRLPAGLEAQVEFNKEGNFLLDTDELGLSEDSVALLLTDDEIKDVSNLTRIPLSGHEKIFGGMTDEVAPLSADGVGGAATSTSTTAATSPGGSTRGGGSRGGGASTASTAGGSTAGSA